MRHYVASEQDRMDAWARGFVKACSEQGLDAEELVKQAALSNTSKLVQKATGKMFGESLPGMIGGAGVDMGLYALPYVGTLRTAADAGSDLLNMFGKGLTAGERARYGASAAGNALFAASSAITGGAYGLGALKAFKPFARFMESLPGVKSMHSAAEGLGASARAGRGWLGSSGVAPRVSRYMLGITPNEYEHIPSIFKAEGWKDLARPGGLKNRLGYWAFGMPRQAAPVIGMMQRPMAEGMYNVGAPPAMNMLRYADTGGWENVAGTRYQNV